MFKFLPKNYDYIDLTVGIDILSKILGIEIMIVIIIIAVIIIGNDKKIIILVIETINSNNNKT